MDELRKGGKNSGVSRQGKKTVRNILDVLLENKIKDVPQFKKFAEKLGVKSDKNIKELFVLICLLNSLKKCGLDDLIKISQILGESGNMDDGNGILDDLAKYLKEGNKGV